MAWAAAVPLLISAAGCSSTPPDPDWVAKQWSATMLAYHIEPVYPPTEDIHIGDIYGVDVDDDASTRNTGPYARAVKLDYVPMRAELEKYYDNVPVLPNTADKPADGKIWRQEPATDQAASSTPSTTPKGAPAAAAKPSSAENTKASAMPRSVFAESGTLTKLPLMAFPGFTIARADMESLSGSVPFHFFSAIFGASRNHQDAITINIPAAETYGVPAGAARIALGKYFKDHPKLCTNEYVGQQLVMVMNAPAPKQTALYLVDRLYLTRSIEYVYDTSTAIGAQGKILAELRATAAKQAAAGAAKQATAPAGGVDAKAISDAATALTNAAKAVADAASVIASTRQPTTTPKQPASPAAPESGAKPTVSPTTAAAIDAAVKKQLADQLATIQANTAQIGSSLGGTFSIGFVSDEGTSLIQTFERPIAIGYRAIKLNPCPAEQSNVR